MYQPKTFVAGLDLGTTFVRCCIYDHKAELVGKCQTRIRLVHPAPGLIEIDPDQLWADVVFVIRNAIKAAGIAASDLTALGIATQRNTFVTWHSHTGLPFHNLIAWNDMRASELCRSWNQSLTFKAIHFGSKLLRCLTGNKRYVAGSIFEMQNAMVTPRLLWALENVAGVKANLKHAAYGCIETWLLRRLTGGDLHQTEFSCASATGMFDPFIVDWSAIILQQLGVPLHILPAVEASNHRFGVCKKDIFGAELPITAIMADQQAALFGCGCLEARSAKLSLGTGAFLDVNTSSQPRCSLNGGVVPLIGWILKSSKTSAESKTGDVVYVVESSCANIGASIDWAVSIGWLASVEASASIASSVADSDGLFFHAGRFNLAQNDLSEVFIGLKSSTSDSQKVRAILESIAFRVYDLFLAMTGEAQLSAEKIRVTGGVAKNDFVCQLIADLCDRPLQRLVEEESTALGVALMAGLGAGFWSSMADVERVIRIGKTFIPQTVQIRNQAQCLYEQWKQQTSILN